MEVGRLIRLAVVALCVCVTPVNMAEAGALGSRSASACPGVSFVTRAEWKARPPKRSAFMPNDVDFAIVHHTDTTPCADPTSCSKAVRQIQIFHMDVRGWDDIGYNFLIGGDNRVYVGRGWNTVGAHAGSKLYNHDSIGISIIGDYTRVLPSPEMLQVLQDLMECGLKLGHLTRYYVLRGHRDVRELGPTTCPGDTLYQEIRKWPHYLED